MDVRITISDIKGITVSGVVIYVNNISGEAADVPSGMAVEFQDADEDILSELDDFVKSLIDKESPVA